MRGDATPESVEVDVRELSFRYPDRLRPALRQVSFSVRRGEALLVLGPSGCGKSTLGLCLNGAIPHFVEGELSGGVSIGGRDVRDASMAEMAQRVGVVFQDPEAQFCMLTVEEEVAFGLENLAVPRAEMDARIDEALGWVGLSDRRGDQIEHLSGGQKQRLALACVLVQRPEVIVFDEPTAQLDAQGAQDVVELLRRLRREGRHTLIVIEHRLDDVMSLVEDVLVLSHDGQVVAFGPPRQVLQTWGDWLSDAGVWVPQVSELATRLAALGMRLDPFPLSVDEAVRALRPNAPSPRPVDGDTRPRDTDPFIQVADLSFSHAGRARPTLSHVNLDVRSGELLALVGPNGAGKSTLASLVVGMRRPPPHTVRCAGRVGYVFQYPEHQFIGRSVLHDVAYGLRRAGLDEATARGRALAMLAEFGLADLADVHPYALSHGEQRRLSVAAMLVLGQPGLFLDEPTFGQDRRNTRLLLDKLDALVAEGHTIVAITHDMRLVAERAARAVVLVDGTVRFDGPPLQLFQQPDLLADAHLRAPPLVEVSQRLGLPRPLLSVDDAVCALAPARVTSR